MNVAAGFHCDVVGCKLARRGVRRGATEATSGSGGVDVMIIKRHVFLPRDAMHPRY